MRQILSPSVAVVARGVLVAAQGFSSQRLANTTAVPAGRTAAVWPHFEAPTVFKFKGRGPRRQVVPRSR